MKKVPLHVYRLEDKLMIEPQVSFDGGANIVRAGANQAGSLVTSEMIQTILIRLNHMDHAIQTLFNLQQAGLAEHRVWMANKFGVVNNNIRAFGGTIEGGFQIQRANAGRRLRRFKDDEGFDVGDDVPNMATLSNNPRSLHELWQEYKYGIDGRKPAEQFTSKERNNRQKGTKQKYYRRNCVWKCIERLVRNGDTPATAIARIRQCYGHSSPVSTIIQGMIRDKKTGGHPNLK